MIDFRAPHPPRILTAIRYAEEIRRKFVKANPLGADSDKTLEGCCGLASVELAIALAEPDALRVGMFIKRYPRFSPLDHAWCVVDDTIIDITATQFSRRFRAVHVVHESDQIHYVPQATGVEAAAKMTDWSYPGWATLLRRLRALR